jgi:hypothetical protein
MKAPQISKMLKNSDGFHPVIMGVIILAIVAIVMGIMIMTYSNISQAVLPSTFKSTTQVIEDKTNIGVLTWVTLTQTIGSTDGLTPYSLTVTKNGTSTLVLGTGYNITIANNTINPAPGNKNASLSITYGSQQGGTTSFNKVDTNMYRGFDLGSIAPIVLAAGLVISVVIGFAAMTLGRRE